MGQRYASGLLWFGEGKPLPEMIREGMDRFAAKFGILPNFAAVCVRDLGTTPVAIEGVEVLGYRTIIPGHVWLGVKDRDITKPQE